MTESPSYHGRSVIKPPVWRPEIPIYFFTGGLGGAAALLSLGARATGQPVLARRALLVGAAAEALSPAFLTADLGRPERFLNMLRLLKLSSPMSIGSWVMSASVASSAAAAALELRARAPRARLALECCSASLGPAMATYTAVLIANTAVPAWQEARRSLPPLFAASSAASAGAACTLACPLAQAGPARALAALGGIATVAIGGLMRRALGPLLAEPYRRGPSGLLRRSADALSAAGAGLIAAPGRSRARLSTGAALILAGQLSLRFAVAQAGGASARDPRQTIVPQRQRQAERVS